MANIIAGAAEFSIAYDIKMHHSICLELKKFIDRITEICLSIESARPRCSSGIDSLCSIHLALDKAKLLIQNCCESSKLYLAITADKTVSRCERMRNTLETSLRKLQKMVPPLLALEISEIVNELQTATFVVESREAEARTLLLALLEQTTSTSDSIEDVELKTCLLVTSGLHITTRRTLAIEKGSIKRLLDAIERTNIEKRKILKYFIYLLMKYGNAIYNDEKRAHLIHSSSSLC